jgi:hypothetical protein
MTAISPPAPDRPIDALDKVYTRLMLGERAVNRQASPAPAKAGVAKPTRQLRRQTQRLRAKQAQIKARMDAAKEIR